MAAGKCRSGPETGREVRRVTADLAEYLSSDRYPLHSRLPPERQLCELLQVSRTALRNGLEELEREGRIWRHVGKGTFVGGGTPVRSVVRRGAGSRYNIERASRSTHSH
jgi:DNA-binding GntR family transcriptional regulator